MEIEEKSDEQSSSFHLNEDTKLDEGKHVLSNLSAFQWMKDFNPKDYEVNQDCPAKKFYIDEKLCTKSLGIVIYMDKSRYTDDPSKDEHIHFPYSNKVFGLIVLKWFETLSPNQRPKELIVNHEHGDINHKCHKQIYIKFSSKIKCHVRPSYFDLDGKRYLCMGQAAMSDVKLRQYCMKKDKFTKEKFFAFDFSAQLQVNEYIEAVQDDGLNELNEAQIKMKDITLDRILEVEKLDKETFFKLFEEAGYHVKEFLIRNMPQVFEFRAAYDEMKLQVAPYQWHFPQHAIEYMNSHDDFLSKVFNRCYLWFNKYCVNNNRDDHSLGTRKKALLIYGLRHKGKTTFIKSFIDDPNADIAKSPYIVYCRQNITAKNFKDKEKFCQLLILDDVRFISKQKEMVKALMVGESVNIESKHVDNYIWSKSLPCVILTNNPYVYNYLITSEEFKTELYPIAVSSYLGPEGTEPDVEEIESVEDETMSEILDLIKRAKEEKKVFDN